MSTQITDETGTSRSHSVLIHLLPTVFTLAAVVAGGLWLLHDSRPSEPVPAATEHAAHVPKESATRAEIAGNGELHDGHQRTADVTSSSDEEWCKGNAGCTTESSVLYLVNSEAQAAAVEETNAARIDMNDPPRRQDVLVVGLEDDARILMALGAGDAIRDSLNLPSLATVDLRE